jgi:hypothetical protein
MMRPFCQCGLQPYGLVDFGKNRLHLRATYKNLSKYPPSIKLVVEGTPMHGNVLFAASPFRTRVQFPMGARLLIGPSPIYPIAARVAGPRGRARLTLTVPAAIWQAKIPIYVQAVCDSQDGSTQPWWFSNGVVLQRDG